MATETVLIDFQVNYTELTNAQAELAKTGKIDTKGFDAIQSAIDNTATDTQGLIKQFKDVAGASIKMGKTVENAFGAGVQDALDEAGVSVEEFAAALKKTNAPAISLKKEMLQLKESLARMKAEGKDTGKEFEALRARAGKLSDAIADANAEIKNAGSDTRGIDNVIGSISALAGGYAAVQGAAALFGEENEDVQKALLKVNAAMALAQGLQVVYNATLKEGALTKLADSVATGAQTAATTLLTFVTGGATVAARAYRAALIATGIGAVVILVLALVDALKGQAESMEDVNKKIEDQNDLLESSIKLLERRTKISEEEAKAAGKSESDILRIRAKALQAEFDLITLTNRRLIIARDGVKKTSEAWFAYNKQIEDNLELQKEIEYQLKILNIQGTAAVKKELEERAKSQKEYREKKKKGLDKQIADNEAALAKQLEDEINYANAVARVRSAATDALINNQNKEVIRKNKERTAFYKKVLADFKKSREDFDKEIVDEFNKRAKEDDELTAKRIRNAQATIEIATRVANIYSLINQQKTAADNAEIASQRRVVEEQLRAGVITQKAAEARNKQIDALARQAQQRAAEREKKAAVFTALLAIPKAFLQGLSQGGIYLAAIYAALAAAEAALIASKPVPKFFRGKKDKYAGPGEVADMGSEIVERNGRMFLYTKPTQTYLGANDKVYTAAETRNIMHNTNISTTVRPAPQKEFDYDRLGRAIPSSSININIDKDFISESVGKGLARNNYMDRRYSSRR